MDVPEDIIEVATHVTSSLLPKKSGERYEREYNDFKKWQSKKGIVGVTEEVALAYINHLSTRFSPNSLWSKWSMIKSCLAVKENVDVLRFDFCLISMLVIKKSFIFRFYKVITFLKRKNENYVPKKAKVLSKEQVEKFLVEAPDESWLLCKVITIFGIFGCCRCNELLSLTVNDVEDTGKYIIVTLKQTKNFTTRRFTITDEGCSFEPCVLYRKYIALRPTGVEGLRLFLTYRNGKCVALNAGQHTIGNVPKTIAQYLGLQKPELYTGHSFRRSGATMVVDAGGDILTLKRAGGWKSSAIAESYVEDSVTQKLQVSKKLFPASSVGVSSVAPAFMESTQQSTVATKCTSAGQFNISGNHNCTITFNIYDSNDKSK
jgi:integrase